LGDFHLQLNLSVSKGELLTFLGPSGCGKTTALRIIAGLLQPDAGEIYLEGKPITHVPVYLRNIGMVFQDNALFPHMSVEGNIGYGPRSRGWKKIQIKNRVGELLDLVGLSGYEKRKIESLSGGEQQRVALARALAAEPSLVLLDEPLSSLDAALRKRMRKEIRRIQQALSLTVVFVTHDQDEAFAVSDRIAVIKDGRLVQIGSPEELYEHPANEWLGSFVGTANKIPCTVVSEDEKRYQIDSRIGPFTVSKSGVKTEFRSGEKAVLFFRPQHVEILERRKDKEASPWILKGIEYYGKYQRLELESEGITIIAEKSNTDKILPGTELFCRTDPDNIILMTY